MRYRPFLATTLMQIDSHQGTTTYFRDVLDTLAMFFAVGRVQFLLACPGRADDRVCQAEIAILLASASNIPLWPPCSDEEDPIQWPPKCITKVNETFLARHYVP
jgi:hypothetical protein